MEHGQCRRVRDLVLSCGPRRGREGGPGAGVPRRRAESHTQLGALRATVRVAHAARPSVTGELRVTRTAVWARLARKLLVPPLGRLSVTGELEAARKLLVPPSRRLAGAQTPPPGVKGGLAAGSVSVPLLTCVGWSQCAAGAGLGTVVRWRQMVWALSWPVGCCLGWLRDSLGTVLACRLLFRLD